MILLNQFNIIICLVLIIEILLLISLIPTWNIKVYAHISSAIPNAIFKEKDGYPIAFLPYPPQPKVNDNSTLLNLNVQNYESDVTNTFISLIIMDTISKKYSTKCPTSFMNLQIPLSHILF